MKHRKESGPSVRLERVGEEVRHALSEIFIQGDLRGLDMDTRLITVSEVRVSPDLRNATAFVMPLGGTDQDATVRALNTAHGAVRGELGRRIRIKYTPRVFFKLDTSFDQASHIDALLSTPKVAHDIRGENIDGSEDPSV
ncbi:MAG: 30S ribosome-binding factor RbfA [Pseudomonadota bacterium]